MGIENNIFYKQEKPFFNAEILRCGKVYLRLKVVYKYTKTFFIRLFVLYVLM